MARSASTSPPLIGSDPTTPASAPPPKPPTITEGVDYSYLTKVNGTPIHWACTVTIDVTLVGSAPRGAQEALITVAAALARNSHLPLRVTPPVHSDRGYKTSTITIRYGKLGTRVGELRVENGATLGVGGPQWDTEGVITSGSLLVRSDTSLTDPQTSLGQHVLMHELAHTLGLGHAGESDHELMAPSAGDSASPTLGVGDQYALAQVGCS
jgi:hypothetical protein